MARSKGMTWVYVGTPKAKAVYQVKVVLRDTKPSIWRRLLLRDDTSLDELHVALQIAFNWTDSHLFEFTVGDRRFQSPPPFDDELVDADVEDARRVRLAALKLAARSRLCYTYDFGDCWEHDLVVEKIIDAAAADAILGEISGVRPTAKSRTPVAWCIAGERAGPIEDCGGVWGYAELCAIMADPRCPEHAERAQWLSEIGEQLDPECFDLSEINRALKRHLKR